MGIKNQKGIKSVATVDESYLHASCMRERLLTFQFLCQMMFYVASAVWA